MMKRRSKWLIGMVLLALGIAALIYIALPKEPQHNGRPLSAWLKDLEQPGTQSEAEKAIRAMGPAAVPYLASSLDQRNSAVVRFYRGNATAQKYLGRLREKFKWHAPVIESRNAAIALGTLGPDGAAAAPKLIAALNDTSPLVAQHAAMALGRMGPSVAPLLNDRLRHGPTSDTIWVLRAIRYLGTNATASPSLLAPLIADKGMLGGEAALSLGTMGSSAVPVITNFLVSANTMIRTRAAIALAQIGPLAISATNALLKAVEDSDSEVRAHALRALFSIRAPTEITRPGWIIGLHDSTPANVVLALQSFAFDPNGIRAHSNEVIRLLESPHMMIRSTASNLLVFLPNAKK